MSPIFVILAIIGVGLLFSQLGGKVSAKSAPAWLFLFGFILFCVITPESLRPIAEVLGIQIVSNLVIAALIFFLIFQAIQETVFATQTSRKLRELISSYTATQFTGTKRNNALVILPTYNEEKNIAQMVARLQAASAHFDFCFINDGSSDSTEEVLRKLNVPFVTHTANIGVSGALMTGLKIARNENYDFVVQCDADGQHPVDKIAELVGIAQREQSDLLIGSRFMKENSHQDSSTTALRRIGSLCISLTLKLFSKNRMTDPTSGFRIYAKNTFPILIREMPEEYPEPEILATLLLKKMKVIETPILMHAREEGTSSISGIKSVQFMLKVTSALIALKLRNL